MFSLFPTVRMRIWWAQLIFTPFAPAIPVPFVTGKRTLGQQHLNQGGGEHGEPGGGEARHGGGDDGEGQEGLGVLQPLAVRSRLTNLQCFTT